LGLDCNKNRQLTIEGLKELQKIVDMDQSTRRLISETLLKISQASSQVAANEPLWVKELNWIKQNEANKAAED
jgi:hypothetical protein